MVRLDERSALRVLNFIVSLISPWSKSWIFHYSCVSDIQRTSEKKLPRKTSFTHYNQHRCKMDKIWKKNRECDKNSHVHFTLNTSRRPSVHRSPGRQHRNCANSTPFLFDTHMKDLCRGQRSLRTISWPLKKLIHSTAWMKYRLLLFVQKSGLPVNVTFFPKKKNWRNDIRRAI